MAATLLTLNIQGTGYVPVLINEDGNVQTDVLAWMVHKKRERIAPRTLDNHAEALARFVDFYRSQEANQTPKEILLKFLDAQVHGCPALGWDGIHSDLAVTRVESVNQFMDWYSDLKGAENPNPKVSQILSLAAQAKAMERIAKTDLLAHLIPATKGQGKVRLIRSTELHSPARRGSDPEPSRPDSKMDLNDFCKLVENEQSPREQLMWLSLGAAGLRISEPMHLFVNDVRYDTQANEPRVLLCDPTYGFIVAPGPDGANHRYTRQEFLKENYNCVPRDQLSTKQTQWAGWKGMRLHDAKEKVAEVFWLHPHFGELFWKAHLQYLAIRGEIDPPHPWYFINVKNNVGAPMSISTARALLKRRCIELKIHSAQHPHALRHMYVDFITNELRMPIHDAQILVRHKSYESTELYARATFEAKKRALSWFMNQSSRPSAKP